MNGGCVQRRGQWLRRAGAATLVVILTAASPTPAAAKGYRLIGDLRVDGYGFSIDRAGVGDFQTFWLQEGTNLSLQGHLWKPAFMIGHLRAQAFALHRLTGDNLANGYRLGAEGALTLWPRSPFPLTVNVRGLGTTVAAGSVPGRDYRTFTLGANWHLALKGIPNLSIAAQETRTELISATAVPQQLTGSDRGQSFQGVNRVANAALAHSAGTSSVQIRYRVEERIDNDRARIGAPAMQQLTQAVSLDGHARLSKRLSLDMYGTGTTNGVDQAAGGPQTRRLDIRGQARFALDDELSGRINYTFHGESTNESLGHVLFLETRWVPTRFAGMRGGVSVDHTDFASTLSTLNTLSRQVMNFGGWINGRTGPFSGHAEENLTLGGTVVSPGSGGIVAGHELKLQGVWRPTSSHLVNLSTFLRNRTDQSSVGSDWHSFDVEGRWSANLMRSLFVRSRIAARLSELRDRRFSSTTEQRFEVRAELSTDAKLASNAGGVIGLGYRFDESSQSLSSAHTAYAQIFARWQPVTSLMLNGGIVWYRQVLTGREQDQFRAHANVRWRIRKVTAVLMYEFSFEDRAGSPGNRHLVRLSLSRSFDARF